MKYLNLGCGNKYHDEWINVDLVPANGSIFECDFLNGIPFDDNVFDVVYHSHVLEHFYKKDGEVFIQECFRILKPGGVLRMAFPDLEKIILEYLKNIQRLEKGEKQAEADYDWILLELYDQTVRNRTRGEMGAYIDNPKISNLNYVYYRIGNPSVNERQSDIIPVGFAQQKLQLQRELFGKSKAKKSFLNIEIVRRVKRVVNKLGYLLLDEKGKQALRLGEFRRSGEIHQWMYDRFSIRRLLTNVGFENIVIRKATESYIKDWERFQLDNKQENSSLFVEATKG